MQCPSTQAYAFGDTFSPKVIAFSFFSLFISASILITTLYFLYDQIALTEILPTFFDSIKQIFIEWIGEHPILAFVLEHKVLMFVLHLLIYMGAGVALYYTFFWLYGFIMSFFIPIFMRDIQNRYYPNVKLKRIPIFHTPLFYIKTISVTSLLLLLLAPTYFIPTLNLLIFLPFYYFFHKTLVFDVSSAILTRKEYNELKKRYWGELKSHTLFCFLMTLIPIAGILLYPFYIHYIGHYVMNKVQEIRYVEAFHAI